MLLEDFPPWFIRVFGTVMGLLWGSFLNVVIYRVPAGLSVVKPPSHCPACKKPVAAYDNIPVISWLILRGKARCCGTPISPRYPAVEAACGLLALAIVEWIILPLPGGTPFEKGLAIFGANLALVLGLIAATFIDLEHLYIPDSITLGATVIGFATASFRPPLGFVESGIGAIVGFMIVWFPFDFLYRKIRKKTGMALGDAKLVMAAGAWFGVQGAFITLVLGAIQGTLFAIFSMVFYGGVEESEAVEKEKAEILAAIDALPDEEKEAALKELEQDPLFEESDEGGMGARIAFGPFLALAMLEYLFFGEWFMEHYFKWVQFS